MPALPTRCGGQAVLSASPPAAADVGLSATDGWRGTGSPLKRRCGGGVRLSHGDQTGRLPAYPGGCVPASAWFEMPRRGAPRTGIKQRQIGETE